MTRAYTALRPFCSPHTVVVMAESRKEARKIVNSHCGYCTDMAVKPLKGRGIKLMT